MTIVPPRRPANPPQQQEIAFRLATQPALRDWMLARLRRNPLPLADGPIANPLRALSTEDTSGFIYALLNAWAAVGDNLTFYQERIANEGFLRTALEEVSIRALIGSVGYSPRPALSATSFLAFTLIEAAGRHGKLLIPKATAIQSVPLPGETSVVFETDRDIEARPEWNLLRPRLPEPILRPALESGITTQLRIAGTGTTVRPGMPVIIATDDETGRSTALARLLTTVEPDATPGVMFAGWDAPIVLPTPNPTNVQCLVCTQTAKLFGASAPAWDKQPDAVKARFGTRQGIAAVSADAGLSWQAETGGLPAENVQAFALDEAGRLYAAMGDSLVRRMADGAWRVIAAPAPRVALLSLLAGPLDVLVVGTQRGEVLRSNDGGLTWYALIGPLAAVPPKGKSSRLPASPVTALAAIGEGVPDTIVAGTAMGLWSAPGHGGYWTPWNDGLPGFDAHSRMAGARVSALLRHPRDKHMIVATDRGLFTAAAPRSAWNAAHVPRGAKPAAGCLALTADGTVFAGTADGVLMSSDGGRVWRATRTRPDTGGAVTHLAGDGKHLFAGGAAGLFRSEDRGEHWARIAAPLTGKPITALAAAPGIAAAAEPFAGFAETDWPGLAIAAEAGALTIDLDRAYPALMPGSWIALSGAQAPGSPDSTPIALPVNAVSTVMRQDFQSSGRVTRIVTAGLPRRIDPRLTTAYIFSRPVALVPTTQDWPMALIGTGMAHGTGGAPAPIRLDGAIEDLADRHISIAGRRPRLRIVRQAGGVRHWDGATGTWQPTGTDNYNCRAMLFSPTHGLILGGQIGVRRFIDGAWRLFGTSLVSQVCYSLAEQADGTILAGMADGLWCAGADTDWRSCGPGAVRITALLVDGGRIFAGTTLGLHVSADETASWRAVPSLAQHEIAALVRTGSGQVIAGTADGKLFMEAGNDWHQPDAPPVIGRIYALAEAGGRVFAGTNGGIFVSADNGKTWNRHGEPDDLDDVRALAIDRDGAVWAAVWGKGVMRDRILRPSGVANDIRSFAFDAKGVLHAGSLFTTALRRFDGTAGEEGEPTYVGQIHAPHLAYMLSNEGPVGADVRRLFDENGIALPPDASVVRSGGTTWTIADDGPAALNIYAMGEDQYRILLETALAVRAPPVILHDGRLRWDLETHKGIRVMLDTLAEEVAYGAAGTATGTVSEVAEIDYARIEEDRLSTVIGLRQPLQHAYDAASVTMNANVVGASHGETPILYEVIGSGDNGLANQSFTLRRQPVTALVRATDAGYRFVIDIRVKNSSPREAVALNGQLRPRDMEEDSVAWTEVDSLESSKPTDTHYLVQENAQGQVTVTFGDGINGRRLPTGQENVLAQYRTGSGPDGNLGSGRLTLPKKRPPGVRKVTNPVPATGGAAGDQLAAMREIGPIQARALGRVVSWRDLEAFAMAWPGIAKATVDALILGGQPILHFTLAGLGDAAMQPPATTLPPLDFGDLRRQLKLCGPRKPTMVLSRYRPLWFNVTADLALDPAGNASAILKQASAALATAFGFKARDVASPVREADVIACLQDIPGVEGVFLRELYPTGARIGYHPVLDAPAAEVVEGARILAGTLLLINANAWDALRPEAGGINLRPMP